MYNHLLYPCKNEEGIDKLNKLYEDVSPLIVKRAVLKKIVNDDISITIRPIINSSDIKCVFYDSVYHIELKNNKIICLLGYTRVNKQKVFTNNDIVEIELGGIKIVRRDPLTNLQFSDTILFEKPLLIEMDSTIRTTFNFSDINLLGIVGEKNGLVTYS